MKPFNLTYALQGKPVVTRDGREVVEITRFKKLSDHNKVIVFLVKGEDLLRSAFTDGACLTSRAESKFDLFMAPIKKFQLVWQHTSGVSKGSNYLGSIHNTREDAESLAHGSAGGSKKFMGIFEYEE